jgi:DNA-binding transcriptional ArsR family regulator
MLARLAQGPASVGELAEPFDMSFAAVSKHLRVLESAGLVRRGRDAQYRPATLNARPLQAASAWLGDYRVFWAESLDALGAILEGLAEAGPAAPAEAPSPEAREPGTNDTEDT